MILNFSNNNPCVTKINGVTLSFKKCESITHDNNNNAILVFKPNTKIKINNQDVSCSNLFINRDGTFQYN